jgi:hypothetical protein
MGPSFQVEAASPRIVKSKAPIAFEEWDGALTGAERGLFLVPSSIAWCGDGGGQGVLALREEALQKQRH